jgi:hypothetical protein
MTENKSQGRRPDPWVRDMADAVPTRVVKEIVNDFRNGPTRPSSMLGPEKEEPKQRGSGWVDPVPLSPPPGTALLDKYFDAAAAGERRRREALAKKQN